MASMNQTEKRHCENRLKEVLSERIRELRVKFTKSSSGLTNAQKLSQIKNRTADLKWNRRHWTEKTRILDIFDYEDDQGDILDTEAFNEAKTGLLKEYRAASDAVQLKPREEAMKLYEAFVKGY